MRVACGAIAARPLRTWSLLWLGTTGFRTKGGSAPLAIGIQRIELTRWINIKIGVCWTFSIIGIQLYKYWIIQKDKERKKNFLWKGVRSIHMFIEQGWLGSLRVLQRQQFSMSLSFRAYFWARLYTVQEDWTDSWDTWGRLNISPLFRQIAGCLRQVSVYLVQVAVYL